MRAWTQVRDPTYQAIWFVYDFTSRTYIEEAKKGKWEFSSVTSQNNYF